MPGYVLAVACVNHIDEVDLAIVVRIIEREVGSERVVDDDTCLSHSLFGVCVKIIIVVLPVVCARTRDADGAIYVKNGRIGVVRLVEEIFPGGTVGSTVSVVVAIAHLVHALLRCSGNAGEVGELDNDHYASRCRSVAANAFLSSGRFTQLFGRTSALQELAVRESFRGTIESVRVFLHHLALFVGQVVIKLVSVHREYDLCAVGLCESRRLW